MSFITVQYVSVTCISVSGVGALQEHSQCLHHQPGQLLLLLCNGVVFTVSWRHRNVVSYRKRLIALNAHGDTHFKPCYALIQFIYVIIVNTI